MKIGSLGEAAPKVAPAKISVPDASVGRVKDSTTERSPFQKLVDGLGKEINSGERTIKAALDARGGSMEPGELLALQAGVYRYGEVVDLASKLIDRTSSGVKTIINGGGQ